jgi:isocitrate dehydrogenase
MAGGPCDVRELHLPPGSELLGYSSGVLSVPSNPVIAIIKGDGIGPEVVESAVRVVDEAVKVAYGGSRRVYWLELIAGRQAYEVCGTPLPEATVEAIRLVRVALKGPLETPVGGGYRSANVALRQVLNLYANIRPVRWYGQPTPYKYPDRVDLVVFRENTEDLYAGIEWPFDSIEAEDFRRFLWERYGVRLAADAGVGVKPISRTATQRLVRLALSWAIRRGRRRVTIAHKGTVMKYTEGAFARWAYEVAVGEFRDKIVLEEEVESTGGVIPEGRVLVNDRLADNMLQQLILRPWDYDVIVCPNVLGDLVSEVAAALVGGVGMVAGINMGDGIAVAEPAHGTAPKHAGRNTANPTASILAGALLLREVLGWHEAADLIERSVVEAIRRGFVTHDLARYASDVKPLGTREYTMKLVEIVRMMG